MPSWTQALQQVFCLVPGLQLHEVVAVPILIQEPLHPDRFGLAGQKPWVEHAQTLRELPEQTYLQAKTVSPVTA
jgi:hypothetical protein